MAIIVSDLLINAIMAPDIFNLNNLSISNLIHFTCILFLNFDIWISLSTSPCQHTILSSRNHPRFKSSGSLSNTWLSSRLNLMSWSYQRILLFNKLNLLALSQSLVHILKLQIISVRKIYLLLQVFLLLRI